MLSKVSRNICFASRISNTSFKKWIASLSTRSSAINQTNVLLCLNGSYNLSHVGTQGNETGDRFAKVAIIMNKTVENCHLHEDKEILRSRIKYFINKILNILQKHYAQACTTLYV